MRKYFVLQLLLLLVATNSCKKDEKEDTTTTTTYKVNVYDLSQDSEWDRLVVGSDSSSAFVKIEDGKPVSAYFAASPQELGYSAFFDKYGRIEEIIAEDYIFLFSNFSGTKVDIAVIRPDGTKVMERGVDVGFDVEYDLTKATDDANWLRLVSRGLGIAACGSGIVTAVPTMGISLAATLTGCGVTILTEKGYNFRGLKEIGLAATLIGCATSAGLSCVLDVGATATGYLADALDKKNAQQEEIELLRVVLDNPNTYDPVVHTKSVSNISSGSAVSGGEINVNNNNIFSRGICWSTSPVPTVSDRVAFGGFGETDFSLQMTELNPETQYYVRAFAEWGYGYIYGETQSFQTTSGGSVVVNLSVTPTVVNSGGSAHVYLALYNPGEAIALETLKMTEVCISGWAAGQSTEDETSLAGITLNAGQTLVLVDQSGAVSNTGNTDVTMQLTVTVWAGGGNASSSSVTYKIIKESSKSNEISRINGISEILRN